MTETDGSFMRSSMAAEGERLRFGAGFWLFALKAN
jgi:hypothetical protein